MRKTMFVAMMATVMTIGTAAAQTAQNNDEQKCTKISAEEMAKSQTERMTKVFGLNEEQQKRLYDYDIKRFNKLQKQAEVAREARESARKNHNQKMQKILTPEQYQKWCEMQK